MDLRTPLVALTRHFDRDAGPVRRHRLASASATTADGVPALVQVEYVAVLGEPDEAVDDAVADAVEDAIRQAVAARRVADLPTAGDTADWVRPDLVPGVRVEHVVVRLSDVQVTPELRRLVARDP
jgi:hypothetical protein